MSGLDLAKSVGLKLEQCQTKFERGKNFSSVTEIEDFLHKKFERGILVTWQIKEIVWGTFDGEKILFKENQPPQLDDWLECRIFNADAELHLKRVGKIFRGRFVHDDDNDGEEIFYVDSFARLWGKKVSAKDGWITLRDEQRKLCMEIPCDNSDKKFYGLTTRNYIDSDDETGLSGYFDYRFVAIESAWDGD